MLGDLKLNLFYSGRNKSVYSFKENGLGNVEQNKISYTIRDDNQRHVHVKPVIANPAVRTDEHQ